MSDMSRPPVGPGAPRGTGPGTPPGAGPATPTGDPGRDVVRRATLAGGTIGSLAGVAVILAVVVWIVSMFAGWLPSLNPFRDETQDRTGPSVLKSLTDLSEYHAASGHYETVVDIKDDDGILPDFIQGERVLYVGKGDVDAVVDFGRLDASRVEVNEERTSVTVRLPAPTIGKPNLDIATSYVANRDQGIINRFRGSNLEKRAQLKAVEQMTVAASGEDTLRDRAEQNTSVMLRGLFGALGFTDITITFDEDER